MIPSFSEVCEGVTLRCITTDKFKTGMLALSIPMPREKFTTPYQLLLAGIMRRGTKKYPSIAALNRRLDELYAATIEVKSSACGENKIFYLASELLDNTYTENGEDIADGVLNVMSEMLFSPLLDKDSLFPEKSVEQEKKILADNFRSIINNPRAYSTNRLFEAMDKDSNTRLTLEEAIDAAENISREGITDYYINKIANRGLEFFYVGSLSEKEISEKILRHFAPRKISGRELCPINAKEAREKANFVSEKMPISQGNLAIGFRTGIAANDQRHYALFVFNEIFGMSPISKLYMNVREKMSLCYHCSSSYNIYTGNVIVSSGIDCKNKEKTEKAIMNELENIKRGKITENEFNAAKRSLENYYRQIFDNPFDLFGFYSGRTVAGLDISIDECRKKVASVTLDDVIDVSQKVKLDTVYFLAGNKEGGEPSDEE